MCTQFMQLHLHDRSRVDGPSGTKNFFPGIWLSALTQGMLERCPGCAYFRTTRTVESGTGVKYTNSPTEPDPVSSNHVLSILEKFAILKKCLGLVESKFADNWYWVNFWNWQTDDITKYVSWFNFRNVKRHQSFI